MYFVGFLQRLGCCSELRSESGSVSKALSPFFSLDLLDEPIVAVTVFKGCDLG